MPNVSQTGGTFLDKAVDFIIPLYVVAFLNTVLYRNTFILINYWSFVHLIAGIVFYLIFPKRLKLWIWLNLVFEVVEYILALGGNPLFVEETIDIILDVVWGIIGFLGAKCAVELCWPRVKKKFAR